ncbi:DUF2935 domain-containing protein [Camelliibacillus cellulosilyticus]|uniref:DUF2935 domain-containing protein n=1 Tax=Camelliibacillus cellulosilyticus TaxID=2174486 RepID=A0ABV9GGU6_9BACL
MVKTYEQAAAFEHRFWLQVLGDHARFIYLALIVSETALIERAKQYIYEFDNLLAEARKPLSTNAFQQLSKQANQAAQSIRAYKLEIIRGQLENNVQIHFTPVFINHMVNEVEEYIRLLPYLERGETPPLMHEIHHHLLWLQDAYGHSHALESNLAVTENPLIEKTETFTEEFKEFYLKADDMAGLLRSGLHEFPALARFNTEVELKMAIFKDFLRELEELEIRNEVLDMISPLMPDHMAREECYYLIKLAESRGKQLPGCDPTKPRVKQKL